jgi:hypothetical protein
VPIIDYKCPKCEVVMPIFRKVDEAEIDYKCSNCEIAMERVWAPLAAARADAWPISPASSVALRPSPGSTDRVTEKSAGITRASRAGMV